MNGKIVIGLALAGAGFIGAKIYKGRKEQKLKEERGYNKTWSEKTISEKEAWVKYHSKNSPKWIHKGVDLLREDLERQKAGDN